METLEESVCRWRKELHQIPEIGFHEKKTVHYLEHELKEMGYHPEYILETGLCIFLDYGKNASIAFRSDIDGLKIKEETHCAFASHHDGYMHACGHDGHMAALLGLAKKLKENNDYPYNIVLIFQPGEEVCDGAKKVIETGIFEKYCIKAIFGMHMFPDVEEGMIACRKGPLMAESGELDVTVHGKSAHAGKYHEGIDSIVIASQLISNYQSIISRMVSPMEPAVLNIGYIQGGTVRNIVGSQTVFNGTVRTYSEAVFDRIVKAMEGFNKGCEESYGCKIDFMCHPFNPPVLNDAYLYNQVKILAGNDYIELEEPVMLAEDFSHYQKVVPGVFFYLGTRTHEFNSGLHTASFQFNEKILIKAVDLYYKIATFLDLGE